MVSAALRKTVGRQVVKETNEEMTEQNSLQLTRNLLRIAIFEISYVRGLFPEKYFTDTKVPALNMKIKKLLPMDLESRRLIDWMEKGVYDALKKKFLKTLLFSLCEGEDGPMLEEYAFSFDYSHTSEEVVSVHVSKNGRHKRSFKTGGDDLRYNQYEQMRQSACKMMRTLITLMRTLDAVPDERTIFVKLYYYDDVTPPDYEPPFFRCCTFDERAEEEQWHQLPLRLKVGEINNKHFAFALKVKSALDPCRNEIDQSRMNDEVMSDGSDNSTSSLHSEFVEEKRKERKCTDVMEDDKENPCKTFLDGFVSLVDEDEVTQDVQQETYNSEQIKGWLVERPAAIFHIADIMASFPEISEKHAEELLNQMVKDGILIDIAKDKYKINHQNQIEDGSNSATLVKERQHDNLDVILKEDSIYLKALYYALPLEYVTIGQLQNKLGDGVNHLAARKLIEKMVNEGYVEGTVSNRKMGRRVIHSEKAEKVLQQLQSAFSSQLRLESKVDGNLDCGTPQAQMASSVGQRLPVTEELNGSTCGAVNSFGSDLTRHGLASPSSNYCPRRDDTEFSPGSELNKRTISRESHLNSGEDDGSMAPRTRNSTKRFEPCSQESLDNRTPRKASIVEEPIYQAQKRLRSGF